MSVNRVIKREAFIQGAKRATGVTVIIDVFRAFSVECYLFNNNVESIIPVASKEEAYRLKEENPSFILVGERDGIKLPGFNYGNSPSEIVNIDFTGKTVVHTTSAGTQGLESAENAKVILGGSLVNARATADFIKANYPNEPVTLIAMGWNGTQKAEEDELCAEYLQSLLANQEVCVLDAVAMLKNTAGKKFFDPEQNHIFPEEDFWLCIDVNRFDTVMQYIKDNDGIGRMKLLL